MWANVPVMEIPTVFGKPVLVLAEAADWHLVQLHSAVGFLLGAHQTALEKRHQNKNSVSWRMRYLFQAGKVRERFLQIRLELG